MAFTEQAKTAYKTSAPLKSQDWVSWEE